MKFERIAFLGRQTDLSSTKMKIRSIYGGGFGGTAVDGNVTIGLPGPAVHSVESKRVKAHFKRAIFVAATVSFISMNLLPAVACGPFSRSATFVLRTHPDFPLRRFAAGQLGIIRPEYARSYLVVAYRYLSGIKTPPAKQKELNALWERRLTSPDGKLQNAVEQWSAERRKVQSAPLKDVEVYKFDPYSSGFLNYNSDAFMVATETLKSKIAKFGITDPKVRDWVIAQDQVFGVTTTSAADPSGAKVLAPLPADADAESRADRNYQIACSSFYDGLFDDAIEKFQEIAKDPSSRWQQWGNYLTARAYCRKATHDEKPEIADLKRAEEEIDKILKSKDKSPLAQKAQNIKHFIEYRLDPGNRAKEAVAALLSDGENANLTEALGDYTIILDRILEKKSETEQTPTSWNNENSDAEISIVPASQPTETANKANLGCHSGSVLNHESLLNSAALLAFVFAAAHLMWWRTKSRGAGASRITTMAVFLSISILSFSVASCAQKGNTASPSSVVEKNVPIDPPRMMASQVVLNDEMTNWILNFQDASPQAFEKAITEWKKSKSIPWLVSVISRIPHTDARKGEVLAAVEKVPADSPAYLTLAYHRIRLLNDAGKVKDASTNLMSVLEEFSDKLPPSTRGSFDELGVGIVGSISEFAKLATPSPACVSLEIDELPDPIEDLEKSDHTDKFLVYQGCLTPQAANIINEIAPLSTMTALASNSTLPAKVRMDIAQAGWVRSVMLNDEKTAMTLSPVLSKLQPQLNKPLNAYDAAASGAEKEFAGLSAILHNPAMRPYVTSGLPRETAFDKIDSFRDNWWCADPPTINHGYDESGEKRKEPTPSVAFLSSDEKKQGLKQYTDLKSLGAARNLFAQKMLKLSKAEPKDPGFAEVLHLVVTSTRYGCTDETTTPLSKQVFQELHKNYPASPWTKKTKFWF